MSEPTTNVTVNEAPPVSEPQGEPAELGEGGMKALKAERDRAAKAERDLKALQDQLNQIEASKLSDLEKAQKQASDAAAEADRARAEVLRYKVAAKHGISDEDAELFLTGSDADTLARQAQRLADRDADRKKAGNIAPREGGNPPAEGAGDEKRQFLRDLTQT